MAQPPYGIALIGLKKAALLVDSRYTLQAPAQTDTAKITVIEAPPEFMLVVSYNPGYQSILKDLKQSTRQRFVAMEFDYPNAEAGDFETKRFGESFQREL